MIPTNGSSFGRAGGRPRRGTAGTAEARHFTTFPGAVPNPRAASRRLSPSTYPARRTCPYSSTPFIPPPSTLQAEGYLVLEFYSGATGLSGRFTEGFLHRRLHACLSVVSRNHYGCRSHAESGICPNPIRIHRISLEQVVLSELASRLTCFVNDLVKVATQVVQRNGDADTHRQLKK